MLLFSHPGSVRLSCGHWTIALDLPCPQDMTRIAKLPMPIIVNVEMRTQKTILLKMLFIFSFLTCVSLPPSYDELSVHIFSKFSPY